MSSGILSLQPGGCINKNKFERVMQSDGQEKWPRQKKKNRDEMKLLPKMGLFRNDTRP